MENPYAKPEFNERQMQEIQLGLENINPHAKKTKERTMSDQELKNVSTTDFVTMVKKEQNNDITLTISRNGEILEVTLKRSSVSIPSIYKDIIIRNDKKIG